MSVQAAPPRVLIVADNASARFGGEAILPLKYFTLLARRGRDVHLITHDRNRDALLADFPDLADRMAFSQDTWAHRWLWRIGARLPGAFRDHLIGNLMGLCGLSLPTGTPSVGAMLLAAPGAENSLLRLGAAAEAALG